MSTKKTTSYDISISADGIWAGRGTYDHTETETHVLGSIRDCAAVLGGDQDTADAVYAAIEDALADMDMPADGSIEHAGVTYEWTLAARETLVCGRRIQCDRSGVGHCWRDIDLDDIPGRIVEEIEGEIIDGRVPEGEVIVCSNGLHYRWQTA